MEVNIDSIALSKIREFYTIKPRTIKIGDVEVPEPVRKPLEFGQTYYIADPFATHGACALKWSGDKADELLLKRRRIHLTQDAATRHLKAEILAAGGTVD